MNFMNVQLLFAMIEKVIWYIHFLKIPFHDKFPMPGDPGIFSSYIFWRPQQGIVTVSSIARLKLLEYFLSTICVIYV